MSGSKPSPPKSHANKPAPTKAAPSSTRTGKNERPATRSKGHQAGKEHGHSHGHDGGASVGVGISVDLGGIGQRRAEPDPFAVGGGPAPVAHTQEKPEKPKTKEKQREITRPDPFANVALTGPEAKEESEPPGAIEVSDNPPGSDLPSTVEKPPADQQQTLTAMDNLTKAKAAYKEALQKARDADPKFKTLAANAGTSDGWKKFSDLVKKLDKKFDESEEGKKLLADWKADYDNAVKSGEKIPNESIPPPQNDLEKKKYAVAKAQNNLQDERDNYDTKKNNAVAGDDNVQKIQKQINDPGNADSQKLDQLKVDLEKAKAQATKDWISSNEGKEQKNKVVEAEKELDKAKNAYKPFQQFEGKPAKAASNP